MRPGPDRGSSPKLALPARSAHRYLRPIDGTAHRLMPAPTYRMPAEWEPHRATWIAWPHNRNDWPGKFAPIPWVYVEIVRHLHRSERVRILAIERQRPSRLLARAGVDLSQ